MTVTAPQIGRFHSNTAEVLVLLALLGAGNRDLGDDGLH